MQQSIYDTVAFWLKMCGNFVLSTMCLPLPAMDAVPQEVRFTIEFVPGNRTYDLNRVLLHLGLGTLDCDVNQLIFLTSWAVGRAGVPNVSHLADFWTAWDELLDPAMQYHLYVTESSLMHTWISMPTLQTIIYFCAPIKLLMSCAIIAWLSFIL